MPEGRTMPELLLTADPPRPQVDTRRKGLPAPRPARSRGILVGLGIALSLVGWSDLLLNFYPLQVGNPDWEVGTTGVVFDSLPLGTIGLGMLLYGALEGGRVWLARTASAVMLLAFAGMLGLLSLYLLALPVVWGALDPALGGAFLLAVGRTLFVAGIYLALYGWLAATGIKRSRTEPAIIRGKES